MKRALACLLLLSLLAGCAWLQPAHEPAMSPSPVGQQAFEEPPVPTSTPMSSAGPTAPPPQSLSPTPLPVAAKDLNVLLLGTDRRISDPSTTPLWRTDTLVVVAIRPEQGLIAMLSIPRDLWVDIPGYGNERINVVDYIGERDDGSGGGPALIGDTLEQNLGISINAYARIHFEGLERIIDTLGGVTITSDQAIDEWMDDATGERLVHVEVITGTQRMDGETALGYARWRTQASDLDRTRRQQQILLALRDAIVRPEVLPRLPGLLAALSDTVDTDLRPGQVLSLIGLALRLDSSSYRTRVFDGSMVTDWTTPGGAMVLLPNREQIVAAWAEMLAP